MLLLSLLYNMKQKEKEDEKKTPNNVYVKIIIHNHRDHRHHHNLRLNDETILIHKKSTIQTHKNPKTTNLHYQMFNIFFFASSSMFVIVVFVCLNAVWL